MFIFCLNKSGFRIILILQLLCLSLCPTYGRPSFDEDDTLPDKDHDEQDEDLVDNGNDSEDEDDNEEENDKTPTPLTIENCKFKQGRHRDLCFLQVLYDYRKSGKIKRFEDCDPFLGTAALDECNTIVMLSG